MEKIVFSYKFSGDGEEKVVELHKNEDDGIRDEDVCEMFCDFMSAVGFSMDNVMRYFQE